MQIHELNNYSGELNSGAFIAVDDGNDTGKVSAAEIVADVEKEVDQVNKYLNNRIDNIIAGGDAPSVAEVTDARLGAAALGGKQYSSLGAAIRGQAEQLESNISAIREVELTLSPFANGVYINSTGGTSPDDTSKVTDYIYIGDRVTDTLELRDVFVRGSRCCALYNASKTFTRYISDGTDTRDFTVTLTPEEQYIRITARLADTPRAFFNKIIKRPEAYVSNDNGNDSNDGTMYAPYKTIQKAVDNGHKRIFVDCTSEYTSRIYLYNLNDIIIQPWFYRAYDASDPEALKIKINCGGTINSGVILNKCSNVTLIGIETYDTTQYGYFFTDCENLKCFSCIAHDTFMDGFKLQNVDGEFENCLAYNVGDSSLTHADGFNIHGYGSTVFKNCSAHDCLDDGISHHDACTGVIDGGEYYNCGKGGVASPTHGAQINVYNVHSHHNGYGLYTALEAGKTQKNSIVANCLFHDNSNAGISANGYTLIGFNNVLRNNTRATETLNGGSYILYESNQ